MIKFLKRLWIEFWWGKPVEPTPIQKKNAIAAQQHYQRARIKHKNNHKKGKRK